MVSFDYLCTSCCMCDLYVDEEKIKMKKIIPIIVVLFLWLLWIKAMSYLRTRIQQHPADFGGLGPSEPALVLTPLLILIIIFSTYEIDTILNSAMTSGWLTVWIINGVIITVLTSIWGYKVYLLIRGLLITNK